MAYAADTEQITLSGPPQNLQAIVQNVSMQKGVVALTLSIGNETGIHRAFVRPLGGDSSEITLKLPPQTAPGRYRGEADLDSGKEGAGRMRAVMVEVEPVTRLKLHPGQTTVTANAGSKTDFLLIVMNLGNVQIEIPDSAAFDLDDDEGQNRALGRSLRVEISQGEKRVDKLFEELRISHGGEAHVLVQSGAGVISPGETRRLQCTLVVPEMIKTGRTYSGDWTIGNTAHVVVVDVAKSPRNGEGDKK